MQNKLSSRSFVSFLSLSALMVLTVSPALAQRGSAFLRTNSKITAAFRPVVAIASPSTVEILSENKPIALGTVIEADGLILTKASELQSSPRVKLSDGKTYDAEVISSNEDYDLALLKISAKGLKPIQWRSSKEIEPGDFVSTVGTGSDPVAIGVVSVAPRRVTRRVFSGARPGGYLGVMLGEADGGLRVTQVTDGSGAKKGGIKPDDTIRKVDGKDMKDREDLLRLLSRRKAGETVRVVVKRGKEELDLKITLGKRPADLFNRGDFQNRMGSELSERRTGFPYILQHDTVVKPSECGGPLVDLQGKAVGINIARAGRTESYAIPSDVLPEVIKELKSKVSAPRK